MCVRVYAQQYFLCRDVLLRCEGVCMCVWGCLRLDEGVFTSVCYVCVLCVSCVCELCWCLYVNVCVSVLMRLLCVFFAAFSGCDCACSCICPCV